VDEQLGTSTGQNRALIVHTGGGLGDVLLSGPVIDCVKKAGYTVDFLARSSTAPAIQHHPNLSEVMTISGKDPDDLSQMKEWADRIRQRDYDVCFLLWSTTRWAWTLYYSGIPNRVGQDSRLLYSFLFTHKVSIRSEKGDERSHWTDILLDYPRRFGLEPTAARLCFPLSEPTQREAQELLHKLDFGHLDGPLLGFHCAKGLPLTSDRWPVAHFAKLASALQERLKARIVLTGGPDEVELVKTLSEQLHEPHANLAGKTSLPLLAAVAQQCAVFVCPDSGPMHLAAAVKTPVVGIYALDEDFPDRWAPFGVPHKVIRPARPACPPGCSKPKCPNFACYLKVTPEAVAEAVAALLTEVKVGHPS
jgi:ADP-heptose:LPS heptosyltransferase